MTPAIITGLVLTPAIIAIGQILFKLASRDLGPMGVSSLALLATNTYFIAALLIYGLGTIAWIYTLKTVPVSFAYLFMAITYILVPVLAGFFLGESISLKHIVGSALIIVGIMVAAT